MADERWYETLQKGLALVPSRRGALWTISTLLAVLVAGRGSGSGSAATRKKKRCQEPRAPRAGSAVAPARFHPNRGFAAHPIYRVHKAGIGNRQSRPTPPVSRGPASGQQTIRQKRATVRKLRVPGLNERRDC